MFIYDLSIDIGFLQDGYEHFFIPFEVVEGTVEVEVAHQSLPPGNGNILDWGMYDTRGFRGWGGGNSEPAIVGERAASRSYLTGVLSCACSW